MQLKDKKILITGGLGFIGFNAALYFAKSNEVCVIDDCSRVGVDNNIEQLRSANVEFHKVDISDYKEYELKIEHPLTIQGVNCPVIDADFKPTTPIRWKK